MLITSRRHLSALDDATSICLETLPPEERTKARTSGIKPEKEAKVLALWKARP